MREVSLRIAASVKRATHPTLGRAVTENQLGGPGAGMVDSPEQFPVLGMEGPVIYWGFTHPGMGAGGVHICHSS